jgi:hypothetical protein
METVKDNANKTITREQAWELLNEFNTDPFHLKHS